MTDRQIQYKNLSDVEVVSALNDGDMLIIEHNGTYRRALLSAVGSNTSIEVDATLSESGKAADAKTVGDRISTLNDALNEITVPTTLPNPNALTINGVSYDGNKTVTMTAVQTVNGIMPDDTGDVKLMANGTVKSVNGISPDENGNVTIALTEGGEGTGIVSIVQTTTSPEDGGANVITVTLTSGETSTFQVRNGSKGSPGDPGDPGYTPVRGTDYWTDADKSEIINDVLAALPTAEGVAF